MEPDEIACRLREELCEIGNELPPEDVASIRVLVDAGEWELALDTLCTQIHEYDVPLRSEQVSSLIDRLLVRR